MSADSLYTPILIQYSKESQFSSPPLDDLTSDYIHIKGNNPVCGDSIEWYIKVQNAVIVDIRYKVVGCLISKASAGLLAHLVYQKPISFFIEKHAKLRELLSNESISHPEEDELIDQNWLSLYQVKTYPARQKCALLAWETLANIITKQ